MESREIHAIIMRIPPAVPDGSGLNGGKQMITKNTMPTSKYSWSRSTLRKKENPKLVKSNFAFEHKVSDSTFNDRVLKYQKMGDEFANVTNQIELLSCNVVEAPAIVKYVGEVLMLM